MDKKEPIIQIPYFTFMKILFRMELKLVLILLAGMVACDIVLVRLGISVDWLPLSCAGIAYALFSLERMITPSDNSIFSFTRSAFHFASISVSLLTITGLMAAHLFIWSFYGTISKDLIKAALLHYPGVYLTIFCFFLVFSIFPGAYIPGWPSAFDPFVVVISILLGSTGLTAFYLFAAPSEKVSTLFFLFFLPINYGIQRLIILRKKK